MAPTFAERKQDLAQARGLTQWTAEEGQRMGLCVADGVPYRLSEEALA